MQISIEKLEDDLLLVLCAFEGKGREVERQVEQAMLRAVYGYDVTIEHNVAGKPLLSGTNISISHTCGYAAILLSQQHEVGVDIEYLSERINKIAPRFLRPDEKAYTTEERLVNWCAKEAAYKLYSEDNLTYQEMRVGDERIDNLRREVSVEYTKRLNDSYCLVYCYL
jgi:4'-phosphopantetheinyl transferase